MKTDLVLPNETVLICWVIIKIVIWQMKFWDGFQIDADEMALLTNQIPSQDLMLANQRAWNIILKVFLSGSKIHHVPKAIYQHSWGDWVPVASCPWGRKTDCELIQQKWSHRHRRLDRFQSRPIRFDKQSQRFRAVPKSDTAGQIDAQGKTTQYGFLSSSC